jgi:hypothetical protein
MTASASTHIKVQGHVTTEKEKSEYYELQWHALLKE